MPVGALVLLLLLLQQQLLLLLMLNIVGICVWRSKYRRLIGNVVVEGVEPIRLHRCPRRFLSRVMVLPHDNIPALDRLVRRRRRRVHVYEEISVIVRAAAGHDRESPKKLCDGNGKLTEREKHKQTRQRSKGTADKGHSHNGAEQMTTTMTGDHWERTITSWATVD